MSDRIITLSGIKKTKNSLRDRKPFAVMNRTNDRGIYLPEQLKPQKGK